MCPLLLPVLVNSYKKTSQHATPKPVCRRGGLNINTLLCPDHVYVCLLDSFIQLLLPPHLHAISIFVFSLSAASRPAAQHLAGWNVNHLPHFRHNLKVMMKVMEMVWNGMEVAAAAERHVPVYNPQDPYSSHTSSHVSISQLAVKNKSCRRPFLGMSYQR